MMASDWVDVGPVESIPAGQSTVVDIDDLEIAVFHIDGEFYAIQDLCSHDEYPLSDGDLEGDTVTCAAHGAQFCLRSGEALSAPAYEPVAVFPVRVVEGRVQVRDDRWD
jgi:3-phenylpropionate/trans-cinnamate dioxygenase ferredoxin subunit